MNIHGPYREPGLEFETYRPRVWLKPWCWIRGHDWVTTRNELGAGPRKTYSLRAGIDSVCRRCGAEYLDVWFDRRFELTRFMSEEE